MNRPVRKDEDSHGNTPDSCPVVLLLVDVLNDLDFPDNSQMLQSIDPLGKNISAEKRCKDSGIPAIYVNESANGAQTLRSLSHCLRLIRRVSDGQPVNSRSIRLHVKAETFPFMQRHWIIVFRI